VLLKKLFTLNKLTEGCVWSSWEVDQCSALCDGGRRTKYRNKDKEEEEGGECNGDPIEEEECNKQKCPGNSLLQNGITNTNLLTVF
jgi:hypothetical protein